jgi:hypothetical protein
MMISANSNTSGWHNNSYGWQFKWDNGTAYVFKSAYGGGTGATVLDSSNAPYAWNMNQYVRTTDAPTFTASIYVNADGADGYVASRMWLYSHNNYRGAGVYMSGPTKTWFAGTPYTDFEGLYVISRTDSPGDNSCAQIGYRRWSIDGSGNSIQPGAVYANNFIDYDNNAYYLNLNSGGYLRGRIDVTGGHYNSSLRVLLRADENGSGSGQATLQMWVSEPGITWNWAGFGYNVTNDGGSPNGFSRINTSFGQAYMRFSEGGDLVFYNTNTSGTRSTTAQFGNDGSSSFYGSVFAPAYFESSDMRIKELIENSYIPNGIESVTARLYKKSGKIEIGYYAQDVQDILPSAISVKEDGYLNLSYREVHTAKIAYLEKKIKELEEKLNSLY